MVDPVVTTQPLAGFPGPEMVPAPAPFLAPTPKTEAEIAADKQIADDAKGLADAKAEADKFAAERADQVAKEKAIEDDRKAKQKAAHIVTIVGGKPKNGIANSTSDDGAPIPRDGVLTIALIGTHNPGTGTHPGADIDCVARLPDKSEIGDVVEAYCVPGLTGTSAYVHPPKGESIGTLPVSTGDNVGTCIEVPATGGRRFRKTSVANWQVTGA